MPVSDFLPRTAKWKGRIVTSDPATGRIEIVLGDGAIRQVDQNGALAASRWPKENEVWTVYQQNASWVLGERWFDDTEEFTLDHLKPGDVLLDSNDIYDKNGAKVVTVLGEPANGQVPIWNSSENAWGSSDGLGAVGGGNFIPNPSFRDGIIGYTAGTDNAIALNAISGIFGPECAIVTKTTSTGILSITSPRCKVAPNIRYSGSVSMRRVSLGGPPSRSTSIVINWYDALGIFISSSAAGTLNDSITDFWTRPNTAGNLSPDTVDTAEIVVSVPSVASGEAYYFDGFQLEPGSNITAFNSNYGQSSLGGGMLAPASITARESGVGSGRPFYGPASSRGSVTGMVDMSMYIATDTNAASYYLGGTWHDITLGGASGSALYEFPMTIDPRVADGNRVLTANNLYFFRIQGSGTINGLGFHCGTGDAAATAYLGVYTNTGGGRLARPSTPRATATVNGAGMTGAGYKQANFGSAVTVYQGDWFAIGFTTAVPTVLTSAPNSSTPLSDGLACFQTAVLPTMPDPVGTVTTYLSTPIIVGV